MNTRRAFAVAAAFAAALFVVGCGEAPVEPAPPAMLDGWAAIHRQVMVPSCAFGSCHAGAQPAARLDLAQPSSCRALLNQASCLFPAQPLVVPGAPEQSFFLAKLTGVDLHAQPQTTCGGATNRQMPFGAHPLPDAQIAAVRAWIAGGAVCDDGAAPPARPVPDPPAPPARPQRPPIVIQAVTASATALPAGRQAVLTVTLSQPAPDGGAPLTVQVSDRTILGAPALLLVPAGALTATAPIIGKRPGASELGVRSPDHDQTPAVTIRVTGLGLAEVFTDSDGGNGPWVKLANTSDAPIDLGAYRLSVGPGEDGDATVRLGGVLPPRTCALIGAAPAAAPSPEVPVPLAWNFASALNSDSDATGQPSPTVFGVFGIVDAVAHPANPDDAVIEAIAFSRPPAAGSTFALPPRGHSAIRRGPARWDDQPRPTPTACDATF